MNPVAPREESSRIEMAFHNGELCLHYQPIHAIDSGRIVAFEALVRWNDPENGMRGAADVIPIAERSGLIVELGEWVLGEALRQSKSWRKQGGDHFFRVHVNVSPLQLDRKDLPQRVSALLESSGADPGDLILELTESQWLGNPKQVREQLNHIREWGIRVYLDDFGTGFSSLAYLQELPIDGLKLAGNFTRSLANGLEPNPIIRWVTRMGKSLGLDMIAEEVETDRQLEALRMLHVPLAQGFLLSPPLPAEEVALLMRAGADLRGRGPTIWRQPFFTQALELETFVDRDNLAGFMAAPDGRILSCTERLGRVLGLPSGAQPGEINLRSFFATPGDAERFFSGLARGGQLGTLVARFRTREGKPFWAALSATVSTVADAEPQLTGTLVPLEAPLHPGIETITLDPIASQLLEAACGFTVLLDEQGHLRYTSPSMEASLGAKVLTSQGDPRQVFDCIHPEDMPTARELLAGVLTAGNVAVSFSLRVRAQGGKWRRLEGTARNLLDHPIIRSILVSCRDVTERWEARDELQRFKDFHTTVLEELAEGIVVADAHGHIVYVNPAAAHMVGKTPQNLVGSSELELLPGDQRDLVIAANERRRMGQIDRYEVEVERPDGRRIPVLISGRALTEEGRFAGTLAVLTNVEDLVSARQEAA
ncbi:MAG TPA: EAL domain-containing protein, partial [Acidobacteria bacterium]|nr:EAL domain-containing protein [Acidobacteriota bacterium]